VLKHSVIQCLLCIAKSIMVAQPTCDMQHDIDMATCFKFMDTIGFGCECDIRAALGLCAGEICCNTSQLHIQSMRGMYKHDL